LNNFLAFLGSILGGSLSLILGKLPFALFGEQKLQFIFILSAILRALVFFLVAGSFKEVRVVEPSPPGHFFFVYQPLTIFFNRFQTVIDRVGEGSKKFMQEIGKIGKDPSKPD
jgi:hypothetical protein